MIPVKRRVGRAVGPAVCPTAQTVRCQQKQRLKLRNGPECQNCVLQHAGMCCRLICFATCSVAKRPRPGCMPGFLYQSNYKDHSPHIMCAIFAFVGFQDSSAAIELLLLHV